MKPASPLEAREARHAPLQEILDGLTRSRGGCSDQHCKVRGPSPGQHTNGGCRCYRNLEDLGLALAGEAERLRGLPLLG